MKNSDRESRNKRRRHAEPRSSGRVSPDRQASVGSGHSFSKPTWKNGLPTLIVGGVILAGFFAWAYWTTLAELVGVWNREPDYSHGFFVAPLALYFLWARRNRFPGWAGGFAWPGLILIAWSIGMRGLGAWGFLGSVDGWSIPIWIAGVVWLLGGWKVLRWSSPSIVFLCFMVPLPYRVERWLSLPLQRVATKMSCWVLQSFGQPALAEGNTILIHDHHLEIEQACSGLRIFVGIAALAFAYLILIRRAWWEKLLLLVSIVPIALIANSARIVGTGLLYQYVSGNAAKTFTHDVAGWVMIPLAAGLFALVLWYLGKLVRDVELVDVGAVVRRAQAQTTTS